MTGIFKINNNEVFGSDGTFSGTIGSNATFPAGHVIQQKSTIYTGATSSTGLATAIPSIAVTITNLTAGSYVLIFVSVSAAAAIGYRYGFYVSKSGTTALTGNIADSASNRSRLAVATEGLGGNSLQNLSFVNLDESVSAGSATYTVVSFVESGDTVKINKSDSDADSGSVPRGISSITCLEIAQ